MALEYDSRGNPMWTCLICNKHLDYDIDESIDACKEHVEQVAIKKKEEQNLRYSRIYNTHKEITEDNAIICPYCYAEYPEFWRQIDPEDNCEQKVKCSDCERDFIIIALITIKITSIRKDDYETNYEDTEATL